MRRSGRGPCTYIVEHVEPRRMLAATLPAGFGESLITGGIQSPTSMAFAPDGRVFVGQQSGEVRVVKDGQLLAAPLLTVNEDSFHERGLMGVLVDPDFQNNGFVYVYYTAAADNPAPDPDPASQNRVSRFTVAGDTAVAGSERVLIDLPAVGEGVIHMGGGMAFGGDGMLYVAVGEHDDAGNAARLDVATGKVLRLRPDGTIPEDNPFYAQSTGINRAIYAYGVRSPHTLVAQPGTGRIYLNDVGQGSYEEINEVAAGANYGWPASEGPTTLSGVTNPVYAYAHRDQNSEGCVIGGAFYDGTPQQFPALYNGLYFFADFARGYVRTLDPATRVVGEFATGLAFPTALRLAPDGSLYYLARGELAIGAQPPDGKLYQIKFAANQPPVVTGQPADVFVAAAQPASFSASAGGETPLSYQWLRDGVDIPGATGETYTLPAATLADNGATFRVRVTNGVGNVTSNAATLTVTSDQLPAAEILTPAPGATYAGGQTFTFSGAGADPETGALPPEAFTWRVDFHHAEHSHPFVPSTPGTASGSFTIPTTGETSADVFYRIHLTVRDPASLTASTFRDVVPVRSTLTLASDPAGAALRLDGQPYDTSAPLLGVAGIERSLEAPATQVAGGVAYEFDGWSDGDTSRSRTLSFPAQDATLVARYKPSAATFLSDLDPLGTPLSGYGPFERDRSNGEDAAGDGRPITVGVVEYARGLGTHAASELVYDLGGRFTRFRADVGVDDEAGAGGSVAFQVFADGVPLFDSGVVTGSSPAIPVDVDVTGRGQLRLVVTDAGDGPDFDHADWAMARLEPAAPAEPPPPAPPSGPPAGTAFEAELGKVSGATRVKLKARHTGQGFARLSAPGESVAWTVASPRAANTTLALRYAHGEAGPMVLNVSVNGGTAVPLALKPTGNWNTWKVANARLSLTSGDNEVRVELASSGELHVDSLRVGRTTYEAEAATLAGAQARLDPATPTGSGFVQLRTRGNGARPAAVDLSIDAPATGTHDLHLRYVNGSAQTQTVQLVDPLSGEAVSIDLPPTAGWNDWQYATASMPLAAGRHKLRLTSALPSAVAIDVLIVSPPET